MKLGPITSFSHSAASIFNPTNPRIAASDTLRYRNFAIALDSAKYSERSPRIAKTLLVKTMNGSVVIAKIAGMESTAKMRSVVSTSTRETASGVSIQRPLVTNEKV